jgi:hypothetical protein
MDTVGGLANRDIPVAVPRLEVADLMNMPYLMRF